MTERLEGPSAAVRIRVMKRDRFACTYCGVAGTDAELEIDHIIAVSNGGSHHISNLTTACRACNQAKGSGTAPKEYKAANRSAHPLIGLWLHTFRGDEIHHQGEIIGVDGDAVLVQLYEWLFGSPSCVEVMTKSQVYSAECQLYPSHEQMNDAYTAHSRRREQHRESAARLPA